MPRGRTRSGPPATVRTLGRHVRGPSTAAPIPRCSTRSSTCASGGASCSPRPRSTAASARPTTTARWACCCCATSRTPGGARWCSSATTWSASTPRSCRRPPSGRRRATSRTSPTRWSTAASAASGSASTSSTIPTCAPTARPKHSFTEARHFNLMFKTYAGPVEGAGAEVYLRPETAQGMFVNFKNVLETSRKRPPFGIAQVGKSFRNEITPGNFVFRTREFEQMEMEYFVPPAESAQVVRVLVRRAPELVRRPRHPRRQAAAAGARRGRAVALLVGHERRRVPVPLGLGRARGHRQPRRLRPHASTPTTRARSSTTSTRRPASATSPT